MKFLFSPFGGLFPRMADHLLGPAMATEAHDVKLRNGVLEPWNENCATFDAVAGAKSFHVYGCCCVSWTDIVTAGDLPPDWKRFYIAGREGNGLEAVELKCECEPVYYTGGVPAPTQAPYVVATEQCSREADARAYVYTYVNKWGEEGAPSPASNIVRVDDGTSVTVYDIAQPPDGYGIVGANIYRSATGFREPDGKIQKPQTEFLYVTTLYVPYSSTFVDDYLCLALGPALETHDYRMPPAIDGVLSVRDQIRLVGWRKNKIYFSEHYEPHNWPAVYDLTLDHHIIHMGELNNFLYVTTDSTPYVIDIRGIDPTKPAPVVSVERVMPDIGCQRANGAVMTEHGLFYASPIGLVLLGLKGEVTIVTSPWFGEDEWRKLEPDTITMAYYEGYLFFSTTKATFLFDINGSSYGDARRGELVTLSDAPIACDTTGTGALLFLQDDQIWTWSGGNTPREYVWKSRPLTAGNATGTNTFDANSGLAASGGQMQVRDSLPSRGPVWSPSSIKCVGSGRLIVTDSHGHTIFDRYLGREDPVRMRRSGRHQVYHLEIRSKRPVYSVGMGTAYFTVNEGQ